MNDETKKATTNATADGPAHDDRNAERHVDDASAEEGSAHEAEADVGAKPGADAESEKAAADDLTLRPSPEEHAELRERLLRSLAEMENLRRRTERDLEETRRYAVTNFARDLLEVADNLSRALSTVPSEERERNEFMKNLVIGIEMTERSLMKLFEKHQIKKIEPQRGDKFDHNVHQAMFEVPSDDLPSGSVAEVMQPGYAIAERLLRPALVGVAKGPEGSDRAATEAKAGSAA